MRIITALLMLVSASAYAEVKECKTPIRLYFANGMNNSLMEANDELERLVQHLDGKISKEIPWDKHNIDLAYNVDFGLFENMIEVVHQKRGENMDLAWDAYFKDPNVPQDLKQEMDDYLPSKKLALDEDVLDDQVREYMRAFDENNSVLVVAHSQGNLFTNAAWREVKKMDTNETKDGPLPYSKRFRIHAVATPASYVANGGSYVTLSNDAVINQGVSYLLQKDIVEGRAKKPLPPNAMNTNVRHSLFSHEFVADYLNGSSSGDLISKLVQIEMETLAEQDRDHHRDPTPACLDWFKQQKRDPQRSCISECQAAKVDMNTFYCTNECPMLCSCYNE